MIKGIVAVSAVLLLTPAWAINKCQGPDGATVYQEQPCPGTGSLISDDMAARNSAREQAIREKEQSVKNARERAKRSAEPQEDPEIVEARKACGKRFAIMPVIGMSEETYRTCTTHGIVLKPSTINVTETAHGINKQYVFAGHSDIKYMYFRDGKLNAIQR